MPKKCLPLTPQSIVHRITECAMEGKTRFKLFDGRGLHLLVIAETGMYWHLKYRLEKKEKLLSIGTYPQISLAEARKTTLYIRQLLRSGIDPKNRHKIVFDNHKATRWMDSLRQETANALRLAGVVSMKDALQLIDSNMAIPNIGKLSKDEIRKLCLKSVACEISKTRIRP